MTDRTITGLVFDIQRCSLHDGPGIRTTVFLKGCPLACVWCHNPESISFEPQISYQPARCVNCLTCVSVCPHGAQRVDANGQHILDRAKCQACGTCAETCQGEALRLVGKPMTVDEALTVVLRDRVYYERSGGGLTLSGGEPTSQFEFTRALLEAAHQAGVHTCLETNGVASPERYRQLLPLVDLFLFDYKATDPDLHRQLTGVSNALILDNLDRLQAAGAALVLRCPLIPGINDSEEHLRGIADLARRYPRLVGVEIMPYHNLGVGKAAAIKAAGFLTGVVPPAEATQSAWISQLHALGCASATLSR